MALPLLGLGMLALRGISAVTRIARALPAAGRALGGIGRATASAAGAILRGGGVVAKTLGRGIGTTARVIGRTAKIIKKIGVTSGSFIAGRMSGNRSRNDDRDRAPAEEENNESSQNSSAGGGSGSEEQAAAATPVIADEPSEERPARERLAEIRRKKRDVIFSMIKRVITGGGGGENSSGRGIPGGRLNLNPFLDELRRLRESETAAKAAEANETANARAEKVSWRTRVSNFMKFIMKNMSEKEKSVGEKVSSNIDRQSKIGLLLLAGGLLTKFIMQSQEKLSEMIEGVTKSLSETWDNISGSFTEIKDNIVGGFTETMTGISEWWDGLSIKEMAEGVWGTTKEFFTDVKSNISNMIEKWGEIVEWIKNSWLGKLFGKISNSVEDYSSQFKNFVGEWAEATFGERGEKIDNPIPENSKLNTAEGREELSNRGINTESLNLMLQGFDQRSDSDEEKIIAAYRSGELYNILSEKERSLLDNYLEKYHSGPTGPVDPKQYQVPHEVNGTTEEQLDKLQKILSEHNIATEELGEMIHTTGENLSEYSKKTILELYKAGSLNSVLSPEDKKGLDKYISEETPKETPQKPEVDRMSQKKEEALQVAEVVRKENNEAPESVKSIVHYTVLDQYKNKLIEYEEKLLKAEGEVETRRIQVTIDELKHKIKNLQSEPPIIQSTPTSVNTQPPLVQSIPTSVNFVPDDTYTQNQPMFASTDTAAMNAAVPRGFATNVSAGKKYSPEVEDAIISAHQQTGISENFLRSMAYIESEGKADAVSPTGATGLFQFTEGTGAAYGLVGEGFDNRKNAKANAIAAAKLAIDNKKTLQKTFKNNGIDREITDFDLYMAHQQGASGWAHILRKSKEGGQVASEIRKNMNKNGGRGLNASQFVSHWNKTFASKVATSGYSVNNGNIENSGSVSSSGIDSGTGLSEKDASSAGLNEGVSVNPDDIIKNDLKGKIRNKPITPELKRNVAEAVVAVYGEGSRATLYSGGQAPEGSGENRVGTTRHDMGKAGDFRIYGPDGKQIRGDELGKLAQYWLAGKKGGVGLEMRGGGIHLDEHLDRSRFWNYLADGGSFTAGQKKAVSLGKKGVMPELKTNVSGSKNPPTGNSSNINPASSGSSTSSSLPSAGTAAASAMGGGISEGISTLAKLTGQDTDGIDSSSISSAMSEGLSGLDDMSGMTKFLEMIGVSEENITSLKREIPKLLGDTSSIQFNHKKYIGDWGEADAEYLASIGKGSPVSGLIATGAENTGKVADGLAEDTSSVDSLKGMAIGMLTMPTPIAPHRSSSQDYTTGGGFNRYTAPMITRCTDSAIRRVADAFMAYGMP